MRTTIIHAREIDNRLHALLTAAIPGELRACGDHYRLYHHVAVPSSVLSQLRAEFEFDINPLPEGFEAGQVRLVVSDMDSTLIAIECIDEIADFAGRKAEVSAVTEAAMRGELDFATSLTRRVAQLKGLDEAVLAQVYSQRLRLNPGAETMLAGLRAKGVRFALVSGGFTYFTHKLVARLGLDYSRANQLELEGGQLTGRVLGKIVDAEGKAQFLRELCLELGIESRQVVAMGDGANDLVMMRAAGLGVAYHAKPAVQAQADTALNHMGLDGLLQILDCPEG